MELYWEPATYTREKLEILIDEAKQELDYMKREYFHSRCSELSKKMKSKFRQIVDMNNKLASC